MYILFSDQLKRNSVEVNVYMKEEMLFKINSKTLKNNAKQVMNYV